MDKNDTCKAHSPCAKLNYIFNWLIPIICATIVWTYGIMRSSYEDQDITGQEKDEKDQKMVSGPPRFDYLFLDSIYY